MLKKTERQENPLKKISYFNSMDSINTIKDLLPNEHILNFHENVTALPDWLGEHLKIILGAGDNEQFKGTVNVDAFSMFDVFFCYPEDYEGSLRRNVEYLIKHFYHKKVICFIDINNSEQVDRFCNLFQNRFSLVDGYDMHTPHLSFYCIEKILEPGGIAVNLFEDLRITYILEKRLIEICNTPTESLNSNDGSELLLGRPVFHEISNEKNRKIVQDSYSECFLQHAWKLSKRHPIEVDWSILTDIEGIDRINKANFILALLLLFQDIPQGLKAEIKNFRRIWFPTRRKTDLVFTKILEGGKRKSKSRKTRKTRKTRTIRKSGRYNR